MTVEFTYFCDAPPASDDLYDEDGEKRDRCPTHVTTSAEPPYIGSGFLYVREEYPGQVTELHFCGWDCLLRYCATFPPAERIE